MILNLDCRHGLAMLPDNSVDAILTDPPYELGFMGHAWDRSNIAYDVAMWREALRVLKPGGHMLAFSGSRTYHRMTCAIEDAGFEIRDQIMWVYGSGFPKSLDISKAIDKAAGAVREKVKIPASDVANCKNRENLRPFIVAAKELGYHEIDGNIPVTEAAHQWNGWGTALKPAHEPICVARKPLAAKTVAANVLEYGTGGINIDGCRISTDESAARVGHAEMGYGGRNLSDNYVTGGNTGRWPANFIHDGSQEVLSMFPNAPGQQGDLAKQTNARPSSFGGFAPATAHSARAGKNESAARFFYCAKASKRDRNEGLNHLEQRADTSDGALRDGGRESQPRANSHPTVKPTDLMRYLCRLVTSPDGLIVDPFAGSGSTGKAAALEGFQFLGFEIDPHYCDIANARFEAAKNAR